MTKPRSEDSTGPFRDFKKVITSGESLSMSRMDSIEQKAHPWAATSIGGGV
jgi:hypothetical protein